MNDVEFKTVGLTLCRILIILQISYLVCVLELWTLASPNQHNMIQIECAKKQFQNKKMQQLFACMEIGNVRVRDWL